MDAADNSPVAGAHLAGNFASTFTDRDGLVALDLAVPTQVLFSKHGYQEFALGPQQLLLDVTNLVRLDQSSTRCRFLLHGQPAAGAVVMGMRKRVAPIAALTELATCDAQGFADVPLHHKFYCHLGTACSGFMDSDGLQAPHLVSLREDDARFWSFSGVDPTPSNVIAFSAAPWATWFSVNDRSIVLPSGATSVKSLRRAITIDQAQTARLTPGWRYEIVGDTPIGHLEGKGARNATVVLSVTDLPTIRLQDAGNGNPIKDAIAFLIQSPRAANRKLRFLRNPEHPSSQGWLQWSSGWREEQVAEYDCTLRVTARGYRSLEVRDPFRSLADQSTLALDPGSQVLLRLLTGGSPYVGHVRVMDESDQFVVAEGEAEPGGTFRFVGSMHDSVVVHCGYDQTQVVLHTPTVDVVIRPTASIIVATPYDVSERIVLVRDDLMICERTGRTATQVEFRDLMPGSYRVLPRDATDQLGQPHMPNLAGLPVKSGDVAEIPWDAQWQCVESTRGSIGQAVPPGEIWYAIPSFFQPGDRLPSGEIPGKCIEIGPDGTYILPELGGRPHSILIARATNTGVDWLLGSSPAPIMQLSLMDVVVDTSEAWVNSGVHLLGTGDIKRTSMCGPTTWLLTAGELRIPFVSTSVDRVVLRKGNREQAFRRPASAREWRISAQ